MTHSIPDYLKLHTEETPVLPDFPTAAPDLLAGLSDALLQATGWSMQYFNEAASIPGDTDESVDSDASEALNIPVFDTGQQPLGQFVVKPDPVRTPTATSREAKQLASAIGGLISA